MQTFREKFTLVLTAAVYLLFHLRLGPSAASIITGTAAQLLTTAPYCIGFTWILVIIIRFLHAGKRPAWDRIARIFFTIGILFAFYFALYERNERVIKQQEARSVSALSRADHKTVIKNCTADGAGQFQPDIPCQRASSRYQTISADYSAHHYHPTPKVCSSVL